MSGARHRKKGDRVEREIIERLRTAGIKGERYPLSGSSHFRNSGHDLDIYVEPEESPLVFEVKARAEGTGFALLHRWLGEYDGLILKQDRKQPLVVLPWSIFIWLANGEVPDEDAEESVPQESSEGEEKAA